MCKSACASGCGYTDDDRRRAARGNIFTDRIIAVEIARGLVCVVAMRRQVMVLLACLGACGDNQLPSPDAPPEIPPFMPAPHAPMPRVLRHSGTVLSNLQLVTITLAGYADAARELAILAARAPDVPARLAAQIVAFVQRLRATDLFKLPGVAETLDWGQALVALGCVELDPATVEATLGVLLKYQDDLARISGSTARGLVDDARRSG